MMMNMFQFNSVKSGPVQLNTKLLFFCTLCHLVEEHYTVLLVIIPRWHKYMVDVSKLHCLW